MPGNYHGKVPLKGKTPTGSKIKHVRKKRKRELGRSPTNTKMGAKRTKKVGKKGGGFKTRLLSDSYVNLAVGGRTQRARLLGLVENPASRFLTRDKVITKGSIVRTELGLARVTSRPGQDGVINAILTEKGTSKAEK